METDKLYKFFMGLLFFILTLTASGLSYAQSTDINFNLSANHYYNPGDKVTINISSYDYSNKSAKRNNFKVHILKIKNLEEFYSKQVYRGSIDILGSDSTNLLFLTEEIRSFTKTIKQQNDYGYAYFNDAIEINGLEKGAYIAKVTNKNKVAYIGFVISSLGVLAKAGTGTMLGYVVNRQTGEPINDVSLNFYIGMNKVGSGVTNNGTAYQTFELPPQTAGDINAPKAPLIIGQQGDDVIISDSYMYFGYGENKYSVYIYTNQPVYRTDSQVEFKGIVRTMKGFEYAVVPNQDITVKIKDSRNTEVYKEVLRTDEMGSLNGSYKIEKEAPLGDYTIFFEIGENDIYSQTFSIEQYKKPEYKVSVTPEKAQYLNNETIEAKIKADYYFGSPVAGAEVEYNIYKQRYYKPWWSYSEYAWWYEDFYATQDENYMYNNSEMIYSGSGTLNEYGEMTVYYNIKETFKFSNNQRDWRWYVWNDDTDYQYIIQARVVDKSRRQISGVGTVLVTRGQFFITANTNKYLYKPNDDVIFTVRTLDFSDKPVSTDFSVNIYKYNYSKSGDHNKDLVTSFNGKTLSEGTGTVTYKLPYDAEGYYLAEIEARDEKGNKITGAVNFSVYKESYSWWNDDNGGVLIMTDKDSYKIGDTVKAVIINPAAGANVLVSAESDNILYYSVEKFYGTSKEVSIPVTDKFSSNFYIKASYIKDGTMYDAQKMLMVVQEQKFLTVEIDPSKLIYKPKEKGELKVRVLDYMGLPVKNAELSLGIIDESIYAIKPESTTDIRKFFYGPKWVYVSSSFESGNHTYAYSRLLTIYERFNIRSLKESELATVKGQLFDKDRKIVPNATIVIDGEYQAAITNDSGRFEFKLPAGKYSISVYTGKEKNEDVRELTLSKGETKNFILYTEESLNELAEEQRGLETEQSAVVRESIKLKGGRDSESSVIVSNMDESSAKYEYKESGKDNYKTAEVRSDFRDAILWMPSKVTDDNGYATVEVQYPDNLTEWRITSRVVTEDTKVGQNTRTVITRKDLLVRMETPRFLQQNDNVTISTIVHNYLSSEKRTKVKFTAENVQAVNAEEQTITIPPNGEVRLDWNINVTGVTGDAKLYVEALTNEESDAVELKVPLQPAGLKIINNTIADFDDAFKTETKTFNIPASSNLQSASFKFTVSPSIASTILTALDELAGYPYGCVEQTMSRFLPTVVVARAFNELNAPISVATQKDLPKMVEARLNRLYGFQHSDGGWGWWTNDDSNPFMTAYVVYGLNIARSAGYTIKDNVISDGVDAMKSHLQQAIDPTTKAYVLYSLSLADKNSNTLIREYIKQLKKEEDLNDYAKSLIILTLNEIGDKKSADAEVAELIKNVKYSGEGAAYWEGKSFHYNWQDDKVQTTAMALNALVKTNMHADLKNKIVRWLMMQRQGFAWRNTQETAFIVYSMVDYLKNSNELNPDYSVKVFVNDKEYMTKQLTRDDVFKKDEIINIDNSVLVSGDNVIRIEKSGTGKVYFSGTVNYYINSNNVSAMENGFRVEREYHVLKQYDSYNNENIVYRKYNYDGNIKSGDIVLVKLRVYSKDKDLSYFMLEDPIPAGCEVVTDDWAYQIEDESSYGEVYGYPYWKWWYADKDIRDDKVTFFATYLYGDHYEFSYIMRAQIPGQYDINPSVGMLMYYPEVNGNSPTMNMNISDK